MRHVMLLVMLLAIDQLLLDASITRGLGPEMSRLRDGLPRADHLRGVQQRTVESIIDAVFSRT